MGEANVSQENDVIRPQGSGTPKNPIPPSGGSNVQLPQVVGKRKGTDSRKELIELLLLSRSTLRKTEHAVARSAPEEHCYLVEHVESAIDSIAQALTHFQIYDG